MFALSVIGWLAVRSVRLISGHLMDKSHGLPGFVVEGDFNIVTRQEVKALDIFPLVGHFKVPSYML